MSLWTSTDPQQWQEQLDTYWEAVGKSRKERLPELDRWYVEELPGVLQGRSPPFLEKDELVKLVDWKLTRSKWRPRLLQYAQEAHGPAVTDATLKGLSLLAAGQCGQAGPAPAAVKEALAAVSVIKGVGPATASAVLAAFDPSVPYLSDEAMAAVLGSRDYTVPTFMRLLEALRKKARELSSQGGRTWTARDVELCLFAEAVAAAAPAEAQGKRGRGSKQPAAKQPAAKKRRH